MESRNRGTCVVLGSADCLRDDLAAYSGPRDGVVACNDAGVIWPGRLDAWVSLHAPHFRRWVRDRTGEPAQKLVGHAKARDAFPAEAMPGVEFTEHRFPGQQSSGSSGLFAAKVALVDLGFDRVVFCGVPMSRAPHFWDAEPWRDADEFRRGWLEVDPEWRARMRSQSGWTRDILGPPME